MTVLAVADHRRGDLREVSYELVTAGRDLADATGGELHVAAVSGDVESLAADLNLAGVDCVHAVDYGEEFNHDVYLQVVEALDAELRPDVVLMPNSVNGLDYAPAVAESLDLPLVTDAVDLGWDGGLTATREMYGSKVETTVEVRRARSVPENGTQPGDREERSSSNSRTQSGDSAVRVAATIRGGEWPTNKQPGDAAVEAFEVDIDDSRVRSRIQGFEEMAGGDVDIDEADIIVAVGRGIGEEENLELVERLAEALDATLAASRPVVDNEWLPKTRQVGQSGAVVAPDVYIAVGISGAVQHVAGMKGSDTIVAINTDPNAPIFDIADYGIVADLFDVVPALVAEFE